MSYALLIQCAYNNYCVIKITHMHIIFDANFHCCWKCTTPQFPHINNFHSSTGCIGVWLRYKKMNSGPRSLQQPLITLWLLAISCVAMVIHKWCNVVNIITLVSSHHSLLHTSAGSMPNWTMPCQDRRWVQQGSVWHSLRSHYCRTCVHNVFVWT